jgi:hypothetical protein
MIKKLIGWLSVLVVGVMAQSADNYTGWNDTCQFTNFYKDTTCIGKVFQVSDFENKILIYSANDTGTAGFLNDSINFVCGYQRGYFVSNGNGIKDTTWRVVAWIDTFKMCDSASRAQNIMRSTDGNLVDYTTGQETFYPKKIDTTNVTGLAVLTAPSVQIWSPVIRPVIKGVTGNKVGKKVKVIFAITQRKYMSVRAQ